MGLLMHLLLSSVLLMVVAKLVSGFEVHNWGAAILGALALGLINAIVRPVAVFLSFPITFLTLGLFLLVINALMLKLAAALVPGVQVKGFLPAVWASLLLSVLNLVLYKLV